MSTSTTMFSNRTGRLVTMPPASACTRQSSRLWSSSMSVWGWGLQMLCVCVRVCDERKSLQNFKFWLIRIISVTHGTWSGASYSYFTFWEYGTQQLANTSGTYLTPPCTYTCRCSPLAVLSKRVSAQSVLTLNASCVVMVTAFSGRDRPCSDPTHSLGGGGYSTMSIDQLYTTQGYLYTPYLSDNLWEPIPRVLQRVVKLVPLSETFFPLLWQLLIGIIEQWAVHHVCVHLHNLQDHRLNKRWGTCTWKQCDMYVFAMLHVCVQTV